MKELLALVLGASVSIASLGMVGIPRSVAALPDLRAQATSDPIPTVTLSQLAGSEWLLENLAGTGVVDRVQTTLYFDGSNQLYGQGACNRYRAGVQSQGDRLTVGAIAATRMMCVPAVMDQESRYFQALQTAQRVSLQDGSLLIYSQGSEAPLRFSRLSAAPPTPVTSGVTGTADATGMTTLVFFEGQRNVVRVFVREGQTRMNLYNKQDRVTWMRSVEVETRETREGTIYTNRFGEAQIVVVVPRSGEPPRLVINGEIDR